MVVGTDALLCQCKFTRGLVYYEGVMYYEGVTIHELDFVDLWGGSSS
jgi:hypothetical protein